MANRDLHTSNGATRWNCVCGGSGRELEQGFWHTVQGHEVMTERFSLGRWRNEGKTVADLLFEVRMLKGEHPSVTLDRLTRLAEHWQAELADSRN